MIECETKTRKWGNSLGVTLPKEVVKESKIKANQEIRVLIMKPNQTLRKTFGSMKGKIKKTSQKIKEEIRTELHND